MANEFILRKGLISLGGITFPLTQVSTTYTVDSTDYFVEAISGTFTISLPTAVGIEGKIYQIKNSGAGDITVDPNGGETIDGSGTVVLGPKQSLYIVSNDANWLIGGANGISFIWEGTWSSGSNYDENDVVYYDGSSYIAVANVSSGQNPPDNNSNWELMAQAGTSGTSGSSGISGSSGSSGTSGSSGSDGSSGTSGSSGSSGTSGTSGS
jgi:hypothetical protein